jgi:hypothetical protein
MYQSSDQIGISNADTAHRSPKRGASQHEAGSCAAPYSQIRDLLAIVSSSRKYSPSCPSYKLGQSVFPVNTSGQNPHTFCLVVQRTALHITILHTFIVKWRRKRPKRPRRSPALSKVRFFLLSLVSLRAPDPAPPDTVFLLRMGIFIILIIALSFLGIGLFIITFLSAMMSTVAFYTWLGRKLGLLGTPAGRDVSLLGTIKYELSDLFSSHDKSTTDGLAAANVTAKLSEEVPAAVVEGSEGYGTMTIMSGRIVWLVIGAAVLYLVPRPRQTPPESRHGEKDVHSDDLRDILRKVDHIAEKVNDIARKVDNMALKSESYDALAEYDH